jgi:hypothetical protein
VAPRVCQMQRKIFYNFMALLQDPRCRCRAIVRPRQSTGSLEIRASTKADILLSRMPIQQSPGGGTIKGEPMGGISAMVFPLRNPPVPLESIADHLRPLSAAHRKSEQATASHDSAAPAGNGDLQRLEASVQWLKREVQFVRAGPGLGTEKKRMTLPRAAGLPPVSGIPPVTDESSVRRREPSTFRLAPPLASERLQLPPPRRRLGRNLRGALLVVIAGTIVGSITYRISGGGFFPASVPAQAASLQAE